MSIDFEPQTVVDGAGCGEYSEAQLQEEQAATRMDDEGCPNEMALSGEPMSSFRDRTSAA